MASDLPEMASDVPQNDTEASVFPNDDGNGLSQGAIWPEGLPTLAPWSNLSWVFSYRLYSRAMSLRLLSPGSSLGLS
jgi:hypothetical protein